MSIGWNKKTPKIESVDCALEYIQQNLAAPKNQRNNFGNYNYRSCEDILTAVKPLLKDCCASLTLDDDIVMIGDRIYVKAIASLEWGGTNIQTTAFAREELTKKGMDAAQITGSASSYARKYALNGLFCIDDTKDADATNDHGKNNNSKGQKQPPESLNGQDWVIPFGKYKGNRIGSIPLEDLQNYAEFIENKAANDGKELTGMVLEFVNRVEKINRGVK